MRLNHYGYWKQYKKFFCSEVKSCRRAMSADLTKSQLAIILVQINFLDLPI